MTGELGVDIFFVLSGFLISFILLRECQKYNGMIDIALFYKSRFFRLWPALLVYEIVNMIAWSIYMEGATGPKS